MMTDVGFLSDEMKPMISDANYLVLEANYDEEMLKAGPYPEHLKARIVGTGGHLSNVECGKALAENASPALRHVWLCHLSEENNHPELARKTVEQVLRSYGIAPGKDFELDVLKRKMPTGIFELVRGSAPTEQMLFTNEEMGRGK
jgi:phosphoribosyl 1,2-cyclic phosphodiesterase